MSSDLISRTIAGIRPVADAELEGQVRLRLDSLTKPAGSLGKLEEMALRVALVRGESMPSLERRALYIFCADHGVAGEGVSAFPTEVTAQMVRNFLRGGAAITVLCRHFRISPVVVDAGVRGGPEPGVVDCRIGDGTDNFALGPAMSRDQAVACLEAGIRLAREACGRFDVIGAGEMGIANTTAAAALLSAFSGLDPAETVGRGTGLDDGGVERKAGVIRRALQLNRPQAGDPVGVLAAVGGFEIGMTAGLVLGAAAGRLPVVLDGFISCSAALIARALAPASLDAVFFSHRSAERGHARMLEQLGAEPYLSLDMRLGEGTGAAIAINLLEASVRLYRQMATFAEAAVSESGAGRA